MNYSLGRYLGGRTFIKVGYKVRMNGYYHNCKRCNMSKVAMQKNSAVKEEFLSVLKIYNDEDKWIKIKDFTDKLKLVIGNEQDTSLYTKKLEMTTYYGFIEWKDFSKKTSLSRITESGKRFYRALLDNDQDKMNELIMYSLENVIFGRNNCGCSDSDSDLEIPSLFIRTLLKVQYLTYAEYAFLLWKMEDCGTHFTGTIEELIETRSQKNLVLDDVAKKYVDAQPIKALIQWGFLMEDGNVDGDIKITLNKNVKQKYQKRLEHLKIYNIDKFPNDLENKLTDSITNNLSPEWFHAKGKEFAYINDKVAPIYENFRERFAPEKLILLSGKQVLTTIFLNNDNKSNLCYEMEFNQDNRNYCGSIKSGTAYKYGLHYSQKNKTWATGTSAKPKFLNEEEAIRLGTEIRDKLVSGAEIIKNFGALDSIEDYISLYEKLNIITDGFVGKVWFMKYYHMMFPGLFPPVYSQNAQNIVLSYIGEQSNDNSFGRMGQIQFFIKKCNISNVVFNRVFWKYCDNDKIERKEEDVVELKTCLDIPKLKTCLEIQRTPRENRRHPINFIIYGAPGTGKTYSTVEYALAIIENRPVDLRPKSDEDRKETISKYKEYVQKKHIVFTTFHQNYGYEEFIQGLRPDKDSETISFKTVDGVFKRIADIALNDTENKNYVIIIDEINRANISKVFGELITLIEDDKRWGELNEMSTTLQSGDVFAVPNNLYIVGTMNSADKSISLIDAALRRRFSFIEQKPEVDLVKDPVLHKVLDTLNLELVKELDSTDLLVGHSYFMNKSEEDLCDILNNNIIPLLYEYFYDSKKKVASILTEAIDKANAKVEIVDEKVSRLRVKIKGDTDGSEPV